MSRLLDLLPSPESRNPLTRTLFFQDIIAPLLCCYATAVLVVTPNTRLIRICVLPLTLWTLFNTATQVDAVKYFKNSERLVFWNMGLTHLACES
ncbi:hypothetical protein H0H93_010382 [Arthromyces matolae]|nr:hypothetical protein H0H93_010382 [Arthromyces matolae]